MLPESVGCWVQTSTAAGGTAGQGWPAACDSAADAQCQTVVVCCPAQQRLQSAPQRIPGCRIVADPQEDGGMLLTWEGESRWIETTVGVLGEAGRTHCLPPSIRAVKRRHGDAMQLPSIQVRACLAGCLHGHGLPGCAAHSTCCSPRCSILSAAALRPGAAPDRLWRCLHILRLWACCTSHNASLQLTSSPCRSSCEIESSPLPQAAHAQCRLSSLHTSLPDHPCLQLQAAETMTLCPPPVDLIFPDRLQFMQTLILTVADRLGLAGLAQVTVPACCLFTGLCCANMLTVAILSVLMSQASQQERQQLTLGQGDVGAAQPPCKAGPLQQQVCPRVQVDVLMHADNGEIIVTDVNLVPDLSEGSVMLQQASDFPVGY